MSMEFQRLQRRDHPLYAQAMALYAESFPAHEQRVPVSQADILKDPAYRFELLYDGEVWAGLLLCWETAEFVYVEHFCILPQLRGRQYGQQALALLQAQGKPVVLEIDPPVDAISRRRKGFYERAGFQANGFPHVHPPYRAGHDGHRLQVLSWPEPLTEADYRAFDTYLRDVVMK